MENFRIVTSCEAATCTMILSGEADLSVAADIIEIGVMSCDDLAVKRLVVDLSELTFIDSTALGALVHLRNFADAAGKHFQLAKVPARVRRLLAISGLDQVIPVAEDEPAVPDDSSTPPTLRGRQCAAITASRNRCQLQALHDGAHACATLVAYLTWTADREPYHWSLSKPPEWLLALDWMPETQPRIEPTSLNGWDEARRD